MTLDTVKTIAEIVAAVFSTLAVIIGLVNTSRTERVRQEQRNVASALSQVKKDGDELRQFLADHQDTRR